jgi:hypothetical protein
MPNSGTVIITGASPNSTPYPSLEALRKQAENGKIILLQKLRDLGEDHPDTLDAMDALAWMHHELGEHRQARHLHVVVMEQQQSLLGKNNPKMLCIMGSLASTYFQLGQFKQSEGLTVQVLEKWREVLSEDHPDSLHTMSNSAAIYDRLGLMMTREERGKRRGLDTWDRAAWA